MLPLRTVSRSPKIWKHIVKKRLQHQYKSMHKNSNSKWFLKFQKWRMEKGLQFQEISFRIQLWFQFIFNLFQHVQNTRYGYGYAYKYYLWNYLLPFFRAPIEAHSMIAVYIVLFLHFMYTEIYWMNLKMKRVHTLTVFQHLKLFSRLTNGIIDEITFAQYRVI